MSIEEFNNYYFNEVLEKLTFENKNIILMGDFNIDLMNYNTHNETNDFLNLIFTNSLVPCILKPSRLTTKSKTLIDNILTNLIDIPCTSGNLTISISDHLAQFAKFDLKTTSSQPCTRYKRNYKNFDKDNFIMEFLQINWKETLNLNSNNPNIITSKLISEITNLVEQHAPLIKINPKKHTTKKKPWITNWLLQSINKKQIICKKFIKEKNANKKLIYHDKFTQYRNILSNLLRCSKDNYFKKYFIEHKQNLKLVWQGIKSIINSKHVKESIYT